MSKLITKEAFIVPFFVLCAIWLTFLFQVLLPNHLNDFGVVPLSINHLKGIFFMPLLHGDLSHIVNNSTALAVLLFFTFAVYKRIAYWVLILGWLLSGAFVWLFGGLSFSLGFSSVQHIGASGVVYMLASFLFFSGLFRRSINTIAIALIVVFLYGSMIWGVIPQEFLPVKTEKLISWQGHLGGFLVGIFLAYNFRKYGPKKKTYPWQKKEELDVQAEILWQQYLDSLPEGEPPKTYEQYIAEQKVKRKSWNDLL